MAESPKHPLVTEWMDCQEPPLKPTVAAKLLGVSESYLSQVLSWQRGVSLKRAIAWAKITGLPVEKFMMPEAAQ